MREISEKKLQGRRTMLGVAGLAMAWTAALWLMVPGCSPDTGRRLYDVGVTSNVGGLRAYAVPHQEWLANGRDRMLEDDRKMSQYQLNGYTNPGGNGATRDLKGGRYIILVKNEGEWEWHDEQVQFNKANKFNVEFPEDGN